MRNFTFSFLIPLFLFISLPVVAWGQKEDSIAVRKYMQKCEMFIYKREINNFYLYVDSLSAICKKNRKPSNFFEQTYFNANIMRLEIASQQPDTKGKKSLEMALNFRKEIIDNKEGIEYYVGISLVIAHIYFYMEEYILTTQIATEAYNKGLNEHLKRSEATMSFSHSLASLLETKGNAEIELKALYNALTSFRNASKIFANLYKEKKFNQPLMNCYNNIASAYDNLLDNKNAMKYYKMTDSILEYAPKHGGYYTYKSLLYGNMAGLYLQEEKADTALVYQEKSIEFAKKIFKENDYEWVSIYRVYAHALEANKRIEDAIAYFEKSINMISKNDTEKNGDYAVNYLALADTYYHKNDKIKALSYLQKSLYNNVQNFQDSLDIFKNPDLVEEPKNKFVLQKSLRLKGQILDTFNEEKYKKLAKETYQLLDNALDKYQFEKYFSPKDRLEYRNTVSNNLAIILAYYALKGNTQKAFEVAEKGKYYLFINEVIKKNNKNLAYLTIAQVQQKIQASQTLLEYAYTQNTVLLFAISKEKSEVYDLKIAPDSLDKLVLAYRTTLDYPSLDNKQKHAYQSTILYQILLSQAVKNGFLDSKKHLIIIPQGALSIIPFETLMAEVPARVIQIMKNDKAFNQMSCGEFPYLIKTHAISYYPSATLAFTENTNTKPVYSLDLLNFAPIFKGSPAPFSKNKPYMEQIEKEFEGLNKTFSTSSRFLSRDTIPYLAYSETEAKFLEKLFVGKQMALLNEQATEENLKTYISKARIVHLATHSFANSIDSDKSGVFAFQPKEENYTEKTEDGILFADEIYNMQIRPELLILSSCQGGLGKYVAGEGVLALNRAFMYAGVENIIFSLWKVKDESTQLLMQTFYTEILKGKMYAEALQIAKIELLKNSKGYDFPKFWAGFILNWKQ